MRLFLLNTEWLDVYVIGTPGNCAVALKILIKAICFYDLYFKRHRDYTRDRQLDL